MKSVENFYRIIKTANKFPEIGDEFSFSHDQMIWFANEYNKHVLNLLLELFKIKSIKENYEQNDLCKSDKKDQILESKGKETAFDEICIQLMKLIPGTNE